MEKSGEGWKVRISEEKNNCRQNSGTERKKEIITTNKQKHKNKS